MFRETNEVDIGLENGRTGIVIRNEERKNNPIGTATE
jgi:hypothetical protein